MDTHGVVVTGELAEVDGYVQEGFVVQFDNGNVRGAHLYSSEI